MTVKPDRSNSVELDENPVNDPADRSETGDAEPDGASGADAPQDELSVQTARADENWDKYLRAAAELENVRKRAARDVEQARKFALERFASELLAVRDSLEMGMAAADSADAASILEGNRATFKQLVATLERFGVVEIDPEGDPFDPALHEAMTTQPSNQVEPGTVLTVFQKGYTLNGRLLRPARVVVAA